MEKDNETVMKYRVAWLPKLQWLWYGALSIAIITLITVFMPSIRGYLALHQGAALLDQLDINNPQQELLDRAIAHLQQAAVLLPEEPLPLRYLARAYRASGRIDDALDALKQAHHRDQRSLLVKKELLLSYQKDNHWATVFEDELEVSFERLVGLADMAMRLGTEEQALELYSFISKRWPEYRHRISFCHLLLSVKSPDQQFFDVLEQVKSDIPGYELLRLSKEITTKIQGSELRWAFANCGTPQNEPYGGTDGFFWSNMRGAVIFQIDQPALYQFRITVRQSNPPPVEMAFGINGRIVERAFLTKGDESWSDVTMTVYLDRLIASFDVWFLNDDNINGIDRNAVVRQIEIRRMDFTQVNEYGQ